MPQSLAKNLIHLTFSTKHRTGWLKPEIRPELNAYLAGILREWKCPALIVGSVEDHAHLLFCLSKNVALCKAVEEVKKGSSQMDQDEGHRIARFPLAERLRCVFREPIERAVGESLH